MIYKKVTGEQMIFQVRRNIISKDGRGLNYFQRGGGEKNVLLTWSNGVFLNNPLVFSEPDPRQI